MAISLKVHLKLLESSPPAKKSGEKNCRVFLCDWMKQTNPFCKIEFVLEKFLTSLQLTVFEISHIGDVSVNVDGLGPLDWILETVVNLIADLIKGWVGDLVEGPLKDVMQEVLNNLIPPIPALKSQLKI